MSWSPLHSDVCDWGHSIGSVPIFLEPHAGAQRGEWRGSNRGKWAKSGLVRGFDGWRFFVGAKAVALLAAFHRRDQILVAK